MHARVRLLGHLPVTAESVRFRRRLRCRAIPRRSLKYLSIYTVIYAAAGKLRIQRSDSVEGGNSVLTSWVVL
jgi:hypothetical protein